MDPDLFNHFHACVMPSPKRSKNVAALSVALGSAEPDASCVRVTSTNFAYKLLHLSDFTPQKGDHERQPRQCVGPTL